MTDEQFEAIARIVRGPPRFVELNALLYLGVVSLIAALAGSSRHTLRTSAMRQLFPR
jgi:hypothetical protein